jgi:hypothetical protein
MTHRKEKDPVNQLFTRSLRAQDWIRTSTPCGAAT